MQLSLAHARSVAPAGLQRPAVRARGRASVVVRAGLGEDLINKLTVAIKQSPLNAGKVALAVAQAGDYDQAATKAKVDQLIADNACMVFSWSGCPFCKKAKAVLDGTGARYLALELDEMGQEGKAIRAELARMTERSSVPQVFIGGKFVGGCNDGPGVATLQGNGELVPMLQAAGAL
ncbi:hypothetical protein ABPG75_002898 [Micractinium tetrahymenae]